MAKKQISIPYTKDGSIPHYPVWPDDYTWRESQPFKATITLLSFSRGRSAAYFNVSDEKGAHYCVFITDLFSMIQKPEWSAGKISGMFEPCKRGSNYGIRLLSLK